MVEVVVYGWWEKEVKEIGEREWSAEFFFFQAEDGIRDVRT